MDCWVKLSLPSLTRVPPPPHPGQEYKAAARSLSLNLKVRTQIFLCPCNCMLSLCLETVYVGTRLIDLTPQRNQELRLQLLEGEIGPTQLVEMDWQQLSTGEQREKDSKVQVT